MLVTTLLILAFSGVVTKAATQNVTRLQDPVFKRIPFGSIKPSGWALNQANIQANGLAGHEADWYSYVKGSIWTGGTIEYSQMHEASPYWFNSMVGLAFQLQNQRLIGQVRNWLDYVLDHQEPDGWFGPSESPATDNGTTPRLVWPRYLALFGLIQYAESDSSQTTRILDAVHPFMDTIYNIWANNQSGDSSSDFQFQYQQVRWEELVYSLQWLYDTDPRGKEAQLIETMKLVKASGYDWKNDFFTDAAFPKEAVTDMEMWNHGVNIGEALKSEAVSWRFTNDSTDIENTYYRLTLLDTYHGRPSGTYSADEHLAGLNPSRGTETCDIVEQMFSLATVYGMFGNSSIADRVEKLAYNALPGASTADMWGHQYDQQLNQVWAHNITGEVPWGDNSGYSNVFGMEPNYPCCTVNHPQGFPKFWAHSFFIDPSDNSLIHAFLGPTAFTGPVGNNNVLVEVDTIYPFGSTLKYSIKSTGDMIFKMRIPTYALGSDMTTITINGAKAKTAAPDDMGLHAVQITGGIPTTIELNVNMPLEINTVVNGSVQVNRGPLNFVVQIDHKTTETFAWRSDQAVVAAQSLFPDAPQEYFTAFDNHTHDFTFTATGEWRLAIDPSTITVIEKSSSMASMPYYAFGQGNSPVTMTAQACQIEWDLEDGVAAPPPVSPVECVRREMFNVTLVPYGSSNLRLGQIPVMKKST